MVGLLGLLYVGENELDEADRRRQTDSIKFCFCSSRSPAHGSQAHVTLQASQQFHAAPLPWFYPWGAVRPSGNLDWQSNTDQSHPLISFFQGWSHWDDRRYFISPCLSRMKVLIQNTFIECVEKRKKKQRNMVTFLLLNCFKHMYGYRQHPTSSVTLFLYLWLEWIKEQPMNSKDQPNFRDSDWEDKNERENEMQRLVAVCILSEKIEESCFTVGSPSSVLIIKDDQKWRCAVAKRKACYSLMVVA